MKRISILLITIIFVIAGIMGIGWGAGEDFPNKEIVFCTPWGPGGQLSIATRVLAKKASEVLGGKIVIGLKTGAGGTVLAGYIANSEPDGYNLFIFNSGTNGVTLAVRPVRFSISDFDLLCQTMRMPMAFVGAGDSPYKTLEVLTRYAKEHPGVGSLMFHVLCQPLPQCN